MNPRLDFIYFTALGNTSSAQLAWVGVTWDCIGGATLDVGVDVVHIIVANIKQLPGALGPLAASEGVRGRALYGRFGNIETNFEDNLNLRPFSILPIPSGRDHPGAVVVPVTVTPLSIAASAHLNTVAAIAMD